MQPLVRCLHYIRKQHLPERAPNKTCVHFSAISKPIERSNDGERQALNAKSTANDAMAESNDINTNIEGSDMADYGSVMKSASMDADNAMEVRMDSTMSNARMSTTIASSEMNMKSTTTDVNRYAMDLSEAEIPNFIYYDGSSDSEEMNDCSENELDKTSIPTNFQTEPMNAQESSFTPENFQTDEDFQGIQMSIAENKQRQTAESTVKRLAERPQSVLVSLF